MNLRRFHPSSPGLFCCLIHSFTIIRPALLHKAITALAILGTAPSLNLLQAIETKTTVRSLACVQLQTSFIHIRQKYHAITEKSNDSS